MSSPGGSAGPIAQVEVGMRVVDSDGEQVGTVADLKMGDPEAATEQGQRQSGGPLGGIIAAVAGAEPDVPQPRAAQLLRTGYVKIDAKGFFARDLYAGAEEIHEVNDSGVRLSVPRSRLVPED